MSFKLFEVMLILLRLLSLVWLLGRRYLRKMQRRSGSTKLTTSCQWKKMVSPILLLIFLVEVIGPMKALLYTEGSPRFPYDYIMLENRNLDVSDFLHYAFCFQVQMFPLNWD
ncbi:unnamed protein product [Sphagnum jensenii]|uniref:Endoplasmic reticulum transmembrane protein n=1 Tax=Sphagnum jensenii TaxID=128206 RepID=A0ABP1BSD4_9BRYO